MSTADAQILLVQQDTAEVLKVGPMTIRVLEDGRNTDNRIGAISLTIPGHTPGPPQHWHRMHDETFLITKGRVRFTTGKVDHDTKVGDYVVLSTKAVHTFSNPFDEEGEFFSSFTPAYYVDYLRMLAKWGSDGRKLTPDEMREAQAKFATFPPEEEVE
jgi:quercetin dioxygenase-like cupin family protein